MKFNDYPSVYSYAASKNRSLKKAGFAVFYEWLRTTGPDRSTCDQAAAEGNWHKDGRPYYNVWPGIVDAFLRLDLSKVPARSIQFPGNGILLRLAEQSRVGEFENKGEKFWIRSILVNVFDALHPETNEPMPGSKVVLAHIDVGEQGKHCGAGDDGPVVTWRRFPITDDYTVSEALDKSNVKYGTAGVGAEIPPDVIQKSFQIIAACGLLESDSSVIVPDVLTKDKHRPITEAIIDRARRRGKIGWNVGEAMSRGETSPHFRAPHAALYHVGKGRKKTVIRFRTGEGGGPIIVHRDKMTNVPTGKLDEDEKQCSE